MEEEKKKLSKTDIVKALAIFGLFVIVAYLFGHEIGVAISYTK